MTKHSKQDAQLSGAQQTNRARLDDAFEKLKTLRKETTLDGLLWKELRDAGRP